MSYTLLKPFSQIEKNEFLIKYNQELGLNIEETETALYALEANEIIVDGEPVLDPDYEQKQAEARKEEFLKQFFKVDGYGYFRKQPKGYGSAVESLNTAFNIVSVLGNLPANTLTFYAEPDFTIAEQCTEEWLVENAIKNEVMTPSEFGTFYAQFMMAWNTQEHQ